jgi:hypothetical protein
VLALERSDHGFSGESRGGHARRERLPQAGLRGSHRRWAARHALSGRTQGATARHVTTPERYFATEWRKLFLVSLQPQLLHFRFNCIGQKTLFRIANDCGARS